MVLGTTETCWLCEVPAAGVVAEFVVDGEYDGSDWLVKMAAKLWIQQLFVLSAELSERRLVGRGVVLRIVELL